MNVTQYMKNLEVPKHTVDVVIDTDTFNEVDDQFAIAYLLASGEKLRLKALYAAPFFNEKSSGPKDGMLKSYEEIMRILSLSGHEELMAKTFYGSEAYLPDEKTPIISKAAQDLANRAMEYSPENPLYVIAIGAITNIASALLLDPKIAENIVIVWLGGNGLHMPSAEEFNLRQDVAAVRVVFDSGAPLVQLPCLGVVSGFCISYSEMVHFLKGRNKVCDFLVERVKNEFGDAAEKYPCSRIIWDVTAVAWLLNDEEQFMNAALQHIPIVEYDFHYALDWNRPMMQYVYHIKRDDLAKDLFEKLTKLN